MAALFEDAYAEDMPTMERTGVKLPETETSKKWRVASEEEDELSTSAGSNSDTETSSAEDSPKKSADDINKDLDPSATSTTYFSLLFSYLRCQRRQTSSPPPLRRPKKASQKHMPTAACRECSCQLRFDDTKSDFTNSDVEEKATTTEGLSPQPPASPAPEVSEMLTMAGVLPAPPPGLPFTLSQLNLATFVPPPGLPPPPGLEFLLAAHHQADVKPSVFNPVVFHKELVDILRDLNSDRNTGRAVQRVRDQQVPSVSHASEYVDMLTRALETKNGMNRRSMIAFCAGLVAGEPSAFDRECCAEGLATFFQEVYPELCDEVPKLPALVATELLPTLKNVLPTVDLRKYGTPKFRAN